MKTRQALALLAVVALGSTMAFSQASRTWVSGVGDDANPCSRTAPCKTFAGAISKTAAGGEIDALDPGGFGAVTITKAITIDGGGGQVASVLVSGTNGIVVSAGPSDVVILRNLRIAGIGTGINGIRFLSGKSLILQNDEIFGFTTNGVDIALGADGSSVYIENTHINQNGGDGIRATTTVGHVSVGVENTNVDLSGGVGIHAADHSRIEVHHSFISNFNIGVQAESPSGDAQLAINDGQIVYGNTGAQAGPGTTGLVTSNTEIAFITGTAMNQAGGTISNYTGTSRLHNNTSNGSFSSIPQN